MTLDELKERFGYLLQDSNDYALEELLGMNEEQLLAEFDRIRAAEEKLKETELLLESIGWNRNEANKRTRVYTHSHYSHFMNTVTNEKRNNWGGRRQNATPNTIIYLQELANMLGCIYYDKYGINSETGKINDKYNKKFNDFFENEYKVNA